MKKYLNLILIAGIFSTNVIASNRPSDAVTLLKLSANRLNELNTVSYVYKREINNYKNNYFNETQANCFINFENSQVANLFNFQFTAIDGSTQIYNGTEYFIIDKKDKTIELTTKPSAKTFSSLSFNYNAIPVLRNMLITIADDDSVIKTKKDTLIQGQLFNIVNLCLKNKALDYVNGYRTFSIKFDTNYKLILNSETYLPYQIIETNSLDKKQYNTITTFENLKTNPASPPILSWFYSTYLKEYKLKQGEKNIPIIAKEQILPMWSLPVINFGKNTIVGKNTFDGKLVIMDFWIKNCGPCMASFPKLKALQNKYGKEKFQLLSINSYDDKKDIEFFLKQENPAYLMLYEGQKLAQKLGINSYPTVVIIDKNGKVIQFMEGFDYDAIDQVIAANL